MKNIIKIKPELSSALNGLISSKEKNKESITLKNSLIKDPIEGIKNPRNIKSINLSGDQWVIIDELPGVLFQGVQYYDLKNIGYINNTGIANLIELLKSLLEKGVEVQFVNVNEKIKNKINSMGLDHILNCG